MRGMHRRRAVCSRAGCARSCAGVSRAQAVFRLCGVFAVRMARKRRARATCAECVRSRVLRIVCGCGHAVRACHGVSAGNVCGAVWGRAWVRCVCCTRPKRCGAEAAQEVCSVMSAGVCGASYGGSWVAYAWCVCHLMCHV